MVFSSVTALSKPPPCQQLLSRLSMTVMWLGWTCWQSDPVTAQEEALPPPASFFSLATILSGRDKGAFWIDTGPETWSLIIAVLFSVFWDLSYLKWFLASYIDQ